MNNNIDIKICYNFKLSCIKSLEIQFKLNNQDDIIISNSNSVPTSFDVKEMLLSLIKPQPLNIQLIKNSNNNQNQNQIIYKFKIDIKPSDINTLLLTINNKIVQFYGKNNKFRFTIVDTQLQQQHQQHLQNNNNNNNDTVIISNLPKIIFKNKENIKSIFSYFGNIKNIEILNDNLISLNVIIQFELVTDCNGCFSKMTDKKLVYTSGRSSNGEEDQTIIIDYTISMDQQSYFSLENIRKRKFAEKERLDKLSTESKRIEKEKQLKQIEIENNKRIKELQQQKEQDELNLKLQELNNQIEIENKEIQQRQHQLQQEQNENKKKRKLEKQLKKEEKRKRVQQELDEIKQLEQDIINENKLYQMELAESLKKEQQEKLKLERIEKEKEDMLRDDEIDNKIDEISNWITKLKSILPSKFKQQQQQQQLQDRNDDIYLMPYQFKQYQTNGKYYRQPISNENVMVESKVVNNNQVDHDKMEPMTAVVNTVETDGNNELKSKELKLRELMLKKYLLSGGSKK